MFKFYNDELTKHISVILNYFKGNNLPKNFQTWQYKYPWLISNSDNKAVCKTCIEATEKNVTLPTDYRSAPSKEAFVVNGYNNWTNAVRGFKNHESSNFHQSAILGLSNKKTIVESLSSAKLKEMQEARIALQKIFTTVLTIAKQGLALRGGDNDEHSNLQQFLMMRTEDVPELKKWLDKSRSGYTWTHHDIINEMLQIMAHEIIRKYLLEIKTAKQYALICDETSDISRQEQISISVRIVPDNLSVKEIFLGFYATTDTKSDTFFTIIQDFLLRFNLNMFDMRGQCYDGASNVSGRLTGLQARIRDIKPRALYVHCVAHKLNLVVQDGLENVLYAKSFIGTVKDLINFIRDSPKRLAIYKNLQSENAPNLSPFCPTRYLNIVSIYTYVQAKRAHCRYWSYAYRHIPG
ncbi:Zinc finger MYM-type protein 1 [Cyphomyrmex costatus]|uniref:Zinc finger MYM-type protein 1 n=1 Tax=Cyphomyrmex costatus TaxID=456900 RepID=A0A151IB91_9HYME|nr:Zinc finger MYM-type protein 1 [Cyphomyrmex costatus]